MKLTIVGRKCSPRESFREHSEKKLAKIERLLGPGAEEAMAKVTATAEKSGVVVEVTVAYQGMVVRAEERAPQDLAEALDRCVDALVRQLRKNKTRLEKRLHAAKLTDFSDFANADPEVEEEGDYDIVRSKEVPLKPVELEEAILQMNLVGHQFYLFLNAETNEVNAVYRRRGGGYGVLIPTRE
ncbi:MAG: ribosome-associated translation inhibitor RaiA [Oscillospiraceae bacterium]|nr:ribosome-associated translation inhibitor RaiA [Oscillospiraceae bacterium]